MIDRLVVLGATGDLTARYLVPALAELTTVRQLPPEFTLVGVARDDLDTDSYRRDLLDRLARYGADCSTPGMEGILERLVYHRADAADPEDLRPVLGARRSPVALYFALPPTIALAALQAASEAGLPPTSHLVFEKPFGHDLASARTLNEAIARTIPDATVFRMDHFLGHQTVQNIVGVRLANRVFEPLWNNGHIERVDIVWDETITIEDRAGYYDHTGALRDMLQNHLLQLLALVAMEPPTELAAADLGDRKAEVLRAVRSPTRDDIRQSVRARYAASGSRPGYRDTDGVEPGRNTETLADLTLSIDKPRWAGVPFRMRTGKGLDADRHTVVLTFRPPTHTLLGTGATGDGHAAVAVPNRLTLAMDPDRLALGISINGPGDPLTVEPVELDHVLSAPDCGPYARLLLDVLEGDTTFSIRADEAEEGWRIVEPVLDGWSRDLTPLLEYPVGSAFDRDQLVRARRAG